MPVVLGHRAAFERSAQSRKNRRGGRGRARGSSRGIQQLLDEPRDRGAMRARVTLGAHDDTLVDAQRQLRHHTYDPSIVIRAPATPICNRPNSIGHNPPMSFLRLLLASCLAVVSAADMAAAQTSDLR